MNLGKNVYNLLKRQPEVYVDGLGSFKRNHTPATYDEKRNVYLPPITYIDFDRTGSRGYDFIQYIQQLQRIDRTEAEQMVASQVEELLRRVKEDGQAKLDDLGHLVSYGEDYVFKALDLSGFQYEPLEAITGQHKPVNETSSEEDKLQPIEEETADEVEDSEPAEAGVDEEPEQPMTAEVLEPTELEEEGASSGNTKIWYIMIVLVAIGIMVVLYLVNQRKQQTAVQPSISSEVVDSNSNRPDTAERSLVGDSTLMVDSLEQTRADTVQKQQPETEQLVPEHHSWQIVIGSHKTLAQAYEQAESYNKAGFPRVRVIPSNLARNRKKVIWDSYATKQEVDSALRYVQKHHIKDAWPDKINR